MPPKKTKSTLDELVDFADEANRVLGNYRLDFIIAPDNLRFPTYCVPGLTWQRIKFEAPEFDRLPDDKRGIYALVLCELNTSLPQHGYVIYIGIAGRRSERSLRKRCKDYLNAKKLKKERGGIAYAIGNWKDILYLFYAPVDDAVSTADLEQVEKELNGALLPPYSRAGIEVKTKRLRKAFP